MKSDPADYSIDDLVRDGKTLWTGVREAQARDYMTKKMRVGDRALLWHTGDDGGCVAGLMRVSTPARFDTTQFDPDKPGYDAAATREKPIWYCVHVELLAVAEPRVPRAELRAVPSLAALEVLSEESRLDVQPLQPGDFRLIVKMAGMRQRKNGAAGGIEGGEG